MAVTVARTRSATRNYLQHESYLYKRINFNDAGLQTASTASGAFVVGVLPPGACPMETIVRINTGFNSGQLLLSTTASSGDVINTLDVTEATTGVYVVDRVASLAYSTADRMIFASASSSATAGQADIWIRFYETQSAIS